MFCQKAELIDVTLPVLFMSNIGSNHTPKYSTLKPFHKNVNVRAHTVSFCENFPLDCSNSSAIWSIFLKPFVVCWNDVNMCLKTEVTNVKNYLGT